MSFWVLIRRGENGMQSKRLRSTKTYQTSIKQNKNVAQMKGCQAQLPPYLGKWKLGEIYFSMLCSHSAAAISPQLLFQHVPVIKEWPVHFLSAAAWAVRWVHFLPTPLTCGCHVVGSKVSIPHTHTHPAICLGFLNTRRQQGTSQAGTSVPPPSLLGKDWPINSMWIKYLVEVLHSSKLWVTHRTVCDDCVSVVQW